MITAGELRLARDAAATVQRAYELGSSPSFVAGKSLFINDEETGTQVLIEDQGVHIMVAFPGTASAMDWNTNRKIWARRVPDNGGRLPGRWHRGYAAASKAVSEQVMAKVRMLKTARRPTIVICGHSLGGAVAGVTAAQMIYKGLVSRHVDRLVTFGAPRFAGHQAAEFMNTWWGMDAQRWVLESEVVPYLVPPIGYRHVGRLHHVGSDGELHYRRGLRGFWRETASAVKTPGFDLVGDHSVKEILAWLDAKVAQ